MNYLVAGGVFLRRMRLAPDRVTKHMVRESKLATNGLCQQPDGIASRPNRKGSLPSTFVRSSVGALWHRSLKLKTLT
jgi:hypothetical protein